MIELWFAIAAGMLTGWAMLDGFDFGVGILHLFVARNDRERRQVLAAIGPFWDGNEVWLLAAGGALFVAFPKVLAAGVSGFYFAVFLVLWCLVLRGIAIEFRSHVADPMWRAAWDAVFALASGLLAVFLGAAVGNLLRGVPLDRDGWFALALFTDFTARDPVGILDWYTILVGVFALMLLAGHGALYLCWRTDGPVHERSRIAARGLWPIVGVTWAAVTGATAVVTPSLFTALRDRPLAWAALAVAVCGFAAAVHGPRAGRWRLAFLGSCAFLVGVLGATAACRFPVMLQATGDEARSITAWAAGGDPTGLRTALGWWIPGFSLALVYQWMLFRLHRGRVQAARDGEGY